MNQQDPAKQTAPGVARDIRDTDLSDVDSRIRRWAKFSEEAVNLTPGAWLLYREEGEARTVALDGPKVVGRGEEADVRIHYAWLSRRHFQVRPEDGGYVVEDLDSKNHILVNGQLVRRRVLASGDNITVGAMRFIFAVV